MKIVKFGGTTIETLEMLQRVERIVASEPSPRLVVTSAVAGITDRLREFVAKPKPEADIDTLIAEFRTRHLSLLPEEGTAERREAEEAIDERLQKLERLLYGVVYTEEVTPRTRDLILSVGERLAVPALVARLRAAGLDAQGFETDAIGMITNERHGVSAAILPECDRQIPLHLRPVLEAGALPVVTGFFGVTPEGHVTTFGRNGTDYSAAVLAHALDASVIDIWKDVDGFMSADPKIVKHAYQIDHLSYDEGAELAYFGAQVLHPLAVHPARLKGIQIAIRNILRPSEPGTLISGDGRLRKGVIKSVSHLRSIATVKLHASMAGFRPGMLAEIAGCLGDAAINILSATTSQTCIALLVEEADSERTKRALSKRFRDVGEGIDVLHNHALICAVGEGLAMTEGVAARVFRVVAAQHVNVDLISAGASTVAYHFTVERKDLERTLRAIHAEFFEASA